MLTTLHVVFQFHVVCYVTMVTFQMTFFMDKSASIVIRSYFEFIQMLIIETKFGIYCIP